MRLAIASGKGGTGKTTLSVNLAAYLSSFRAVALADLDVEEPNSGLFLEKTPGERKEMSRMVPSWNEASCTHCGLCQEVCKFGALVAMGPKIMVFPGLCHGCYACSELCPVNALPMKPMRIGELTRYRAKGFDFVESRLDIGQEQAVPLIAQTLSYMDENYEADVVKIYDAPPGTSCPVIEVIKHMDFVILVTEPTPFGLNDLTIAVDTVRLLEKPFAVVINRHGIGDNGVEDFCRWDGIDVAARIPDMRKIAELYSKGEIVYSQVPEMERELEKLHTYIAERGEASR